MRYPKNNCILAPRRVPKPSRKGRCSTTHTHDVAQHFSCIKTLLRPRRLTRRLIVAHYTYALCSMSEPGDNQLLPKRCHVSPAITFSTVSRRLPVLSWPLTHSLSFLLDYYDVIESLRITDSSWGGNGKRLSIAGDLAIRKEWRRVNTTHPTLTAGAE